VVNRVQQAGTAFLVDTSMVSLTTLRPIKADQPAQTGDSVKRMLICEYTLTVNNEASQAGIFDLT
jgi:hypothetical protein